MEILLIYWLQINIAAVFCFNQSTTSHYLPYSLLGRDDYVCEKAINQSLKQEPKSFRVNLDNHPKLRWVEMATYNKYKLETLEKITEQLLTPEILNAFKSCSPFIMKSFGDEYAEEIEGFAKYSGVSSSLIVIYNILYEILTFCTSIIAKVDDKEIIHGRNLDFGILYGQNRDLFPQKMTDIMRGLTYNVEWVRNGKIIARSVQFAGHIGIHTAIKDGNYSFSLNSRFPVGESGISGIFRKILFDTNAEFVTLMSRKLILSDYNFEQVKNYLFSIELISPVYFMIASSNGMGILITRGAKDNLYPKYLHNSTTWWYLLNTNYDHWKNTPLFDHRRTIGNHCMDISREKITDSNQLLQTIFDVLNTKPLLNKHTAFTSIMRPKYNQITSIIQNCKYNCSLF